MKLHLYNTLTDRVEELVPAQPPELRVYVCGLTVYGRGHIGNFRTFLAADLLRRTLRYKGMPVREVMNITDVDDRIIQLAREAGSDLRQFTEPHVKAFEEDLATLRMERPEVVPRATPAWRTSRNWSPPAQTACRSSRRNTRMLPNSPGISPGHPWSKRRDY